MGGRTRRGDAGFTLVEILMVMFITALAGAFVVMSIPEGRSPAQEEARRLRAEIEAAVDLALVSGRSVGLDFDADGRGYELVARGPAGWAATRRGGRRLADGVTAAFDAVDEAATDSLPPDWPEVVVDGLGFATPGVATLSTSIGEPVRVRVAADGRTAIEAGRGA